MVLIIKSARLGLKNLDTAFLPYAPITRKEFLLVGNIFK